VTSAGRKYAAIALKICATVVLFWFVLARIDFSEMAAYLSATRISAGLLAGTAVVLLQSVLASVRLKICARLLGHEVPATTTWVSCQLGGLFSHTPVSFVGGDAMRVWHLTRSGFGLSDSAKAVVIDRALGLLGMLVLVLATAPGLFLAIDDPRMRNGYLALLALGVAAALAFVALGRMQAPRSSSRMLQRASEFVTLARYLSAQPARCAQAIAIAVVMNATNGLAVWLISAAYGAGIGFQAAMVASPAVFLVAMLPISVAGWGLREGALVVGFGLFGVSSADALAVSVTFGIGVLLAYSPAAVLFVRERTRGARAMKEAGYAPASSRPTARS
jgi:hypothetical protein